MEQENALQVWESPESLKARVQKMLEVQQEVMKADVDYGIIPGCKKPSLFKPGAELLMVTFFVAASEPKVVDLSNGDEIRYRLTTAIITQCTEIFLGAGVGECSSNEDKYKWRKVVCEGEWEDTDIARRREKWFKGWDGKPDYKQKQVRTNPSDVANTVLKIAKKRSIIDGVLQSLAASRIYTQDIEDMSKELQEMLKNNDNPKSTKPDITQPTVPVVNGNEVFEEASIIESVNEKTGTGKNGDWVRFGIKINAESYGTFDKKLGEAAKVYLKEKTGILFEWEQNGKFKTITRLYEFVPPESAAESTPTQDAQPIADHETFCTEIKALAKKAGIKKIDELLTAQLAIESLNKVTADQQSTVIDLFNWQVENARAKGK